MKWVKAQRREQAGNQLFSTKLIVGARKGVGTPEQEVQTNIGCWLNNWNAVKREE